MKFSPSGLAWCVLSPGWRIRGAMCGPPGGLIGQSGACSPTWTTSPAWAPTCTLYANKTNSAPLKSATAASYPAARRSSISCLCPMASASAHRSAAGRDGDELLTLVELELDVGVWVCRLVLAVDHD